MDDQKRIVDHSPMIEAAREDAGREGARVVTMSVGALWRLIHRAPSIIAEQDRLAAAPKAR